MPSRHLRAIGAFVLCLICAPLTDVSAQYFGRNKVQYREFDFKVLKTTHFDIYHYPEEQRAVELAARMAERWYTRLSRVLDHRFGDRQPLILYASHPHFEQTNVVGGSIGEGTGGVTEMLKRRVVMPFAGPLAETDHVLGHELVHAFQFSIGKNMQRLMQLPLWFIEGMAEYLSIGAVDTQTAMWLRDAARHDRLPRIKDLAHPRYFPYRYGHALWAFVAGRYGDDVVASALRAGGTTGDPVAAIERVTGVDEETLSKEWHAAIRSTYGGVLEAASTAGSRPLITEESGGGDLNIAPSLSPDGKRLVFLSEKDLFSIELFVADAATGRIQQRITKTATDPHLDSLQFINSAGAWDPSGRRFVFGAIAAGKPILTIVDVDRGREEREIPLAELGEILNPSWSPDGRAIAFSAIAGGLTDLYVYDIEGGRLERLTNDAYADLQPVWSPDGRRIAFVTDRFGTRLPTLEFGPYRVAVMDVASKAIREIGAANGNGSRQTNPQWHPDGRSVYFISDLTGVPDVYRADLDGGALWQVTRVATGVSGITALSPALSVAATEGRIAFTLYRDGKHEIHVIEDVAARAGTRTADGAIAANILPPRERRADIVVQLLGRPTVGLPEARTYDVADYKPRLSLDYVGQPTLMAGTDRFGTFVGGGISFFFSDMLANHQFGTTLQIQGDFDDFAGQAGYFNRKRRWNWGAVAEQIPYVTGTFSTAILNQGGEQIIIEEAELFRQTSRNLSGVVAYPFSRARRVEFTAGLRSISFTRELQTVAFSALTGEVLLEEEEKLGSLPTLNLGEAAAALVFDTSIMGPTSPIVGRRSRLEIAPTVGDLTFTTLMADYRHYFMPVRPVTFAARFLHFGRYGGGSEDERLMPIFLGYPNLIRGYDIGSFSASECVPDATSNCPMIDRLVGSRVAVAGVEMRFPLFGIFKGDLDYGPIPIEGVIFGDAGMAWTRHEDPRFLGGRRDWVRSYGAGLRVNALGFAILEFDIVRPLDRPNKDWMFVFGFRPGF